MLGRLSIATPPAAQPVTIYQARKHLRLDNADDDEMLAIYISSATDLVQSFLNRTLITTTWQWTIADTYSPNAWPLVPVNPAIFVLPLGLEWTLTHLMQRDIELPMSPLQTVNSVTYTLWDAVNDADPQPQSTTRDVDFIVDATTDPGRVRLQEDVPWINRMNLSINFTAGYGDTSTDIPASIIHAILLTVDSMFEGRGDNGAGTMPQSAKNLLWNYRMQTFYS